jgi:hypothetical protein
MTTLPLLTGLHYALDYVQCVSFGYGVLHCLCWSMLMLVALMCGSAVSPLLLVILLPDTMNYAKFVCVVFMWHYCTIICSPYVGVCSLQLSVPLCHYGYPLYSIRLAVDLLFNLSTFVRCVAHVSADANFEADYLPSFRKYAVHVVGIYTALSSIY